MTPPHVRLPIRGPRFINLNTWQNISPSDPAHWLVSATIGALAFFVDSSAKVMDAWLAGLFVFSGYLIPVDLFPTALRPLVEWLPFRYQIGLPVELMVGAHDLDSALTLVGRQVIFVVLAALTTQLVWRQGLTRYAAYGG